VGAAQRARGDGGGGASWCGEAGPERGRGREHSAEGMEASLTGDSVDGERR